jgi:ubiquinone/menaquinone biosynthesis C-methylase UbiE
MENLFNEETEKQLFDLSKNSKLDDTTEFEIRIGNFNKYGFSPGISKEKFNKLLNLSNFKKTELDNTISFLSNSNFNNQRETWYFDKDKKIIKDKVGNIKKNFIQKDKIKVLDIKKYNVRLALSRENVINVKNLNKSNFARYKERISKYTKDNLWRYDFTKVYEIRIKNKSDIKKWNDLDDPDRYEIEIEFLNKSVDNFNEIIVKQLEYIIIFCNKNITFSKKNLITEIYNNLDNIKKNGINNLIFRDITNQPKTLEIQYISLIKENYSVTEKNDGDRCLLFKSDLDNNFYFVNHKMEFKMLEIDQDIELKITLLDCEYVKETNSIIILDVLLYDGEKIYDKYLIERLSKIDLLLELNDNFGNYNLIKKKFYSDDIFKDSNIILSQDKINIDGLIFIPINKKYFNKTFKWKPEKFNTIDFLVKEVKPQEYDLYVGISKSVSQLQNIKISYNFSKIFPELKNCYVKNYFPTKFKIHNEPNIHFLKSNDPMIKNNTVIEFKYIDEKWIPIRVREDKTEMYLKGKSFGNDWNVAVSNFNSIKYPITDDMISGKVDIPVANIHFQNLNQKQKTINMRKFHSEIKTFLYQTYIKSNDNILDLACGKGQDIKKFIECDPNVCVMIDYDNNALFEAHDSAIKRFNNIKKSYDKNYNFKFGLHDISKNIVSKMKELEIEDEKFNIITCNFAIQFILESGSKLNSFVKNISTYLKDNGKLILTHFNSEKIFNLLSDKEQVEIKDADDTKIFTIKKLYNNNKILKYGQKISVDINSIGCHNEYLVNFKNLIQVFEKNNIYLVEHKNFEDISTKIDLSNYEKEFSFLNMYSVFEKKK